MSVVLELDLNKQELELLDELIAGPSDVPSIQMHSLQMNSLKRKLRQAVITGVAMARVYEAAKA